jgi:uncharacterized membrane protein YqhA
MRGLVNFLLGLRAIMLIGSLGAVVGSFAIFLQGSLYLYEAWHVLLQPGDIGGKQLIAPVLEDVDSSFLFGIVLVIFAYGIAIGFVFNLPEDLGQKLPAWINVAGVGQLEETLTEVVVVLIVIFARTVVEVEGQFNFSMLVLPASILFIAAALRPIDFAGVKHGSEEEHAKKHHPMKAALEKSKP